MAKVVDTTPIDLDSIGFGGVATEYEPHARGAYSAIIESLELRTAQNGNPGFNVTFDLTDVDGKQFTWFSLTRKALWKIKQVALRVGCDPERWEQNLTVSDIVDELTNKECTLVVDIEQYKPKNFVEGHPVFGKLKDRNVVTDIFGPDYINHYQAPADNGSGAQTGGKRSRRQF